MDKKDLQKQLDLTKWYSSETIGTDQCGNYDFCAFCTKAGDTPCADAWLKMADADKEENPVEEVAAATESVEYDEFDDGYDETETIGGRKRAVKSFTQKFNEASERLKEHYYEIVKMFLSYRDVKSRISKRCDTYRSRHAVFGRIFITGESLKINLPLDVNAHEDFPHSDSSDQKSLADTPFRFKISSKLSLKRAALLIDEAAEKSGLVKRKYKKEVKNDILK